MLWPPDSLAVKPCAQPHSQEDCRAASRDGGGSLGEQQPPSHAPGQQEDSTDATQPRPGDLFNLRAVRHKSHICHRLRGLCDRSGSRQHAERARRRVRTQGQEAPAPSGPISPGSRRLPPQAGSAVLGHHSWDRWRTGVAAPPPSAAKWTHSGQWLWIPCRKGCPGLRREDNPRQLFPPAALQGSWKEGREWPSHPKEAVFVRKQIRSVGSASSGRAWPPGCGHWAGMPGAFDGCSSCSAPSPTCRAAPA